MQNIIANMNLESKQRPIIKGKVGDKEAYFLLDTGASLALIDESKIKKYNLVKGREFPGTVVGAGGALDKLYYCNSFVNLTEDKKIALFILADISSVRNSIKRETGIEILGIISYKLMQFLGISIDPTNNKVHGI